MLRCRTRAAVRALAAPRCGAWRAERPHILYITADDLGWKDVGYHGSSIRTPTLDRLATEGARLEEFYVQPFSTQTRAAVLTGRYPMRYGLQTMQIQWFSEFGLPADERTLRPGAQGGRLPHRADREVATRARAKGAVADAARLRLASTGI